MKNVKKMPLKKKKKMLSSQTFKFDKKEKVNLNKVT